MTIGQQEKPIRHAMLWNRRFRSPLQATFSPNEQETPDDFNALLEAADRRLNESVSRRNEN